MNKILFSLVGPTASGKTEIVSLLSKKIPLEIISCDSMQVYKQMPILTQAPKQAQKGSDPIRGQTPTHLVEFLSPAEEYNAALFRKDSLLIIEKILKKKKIPGIVGGTGLYLRALLDGLFDSDVTTSRPVTADPFRKKMVKFHEKHGEVCPAGWTKGKTGIKPTTEGIAQFLANQAEEL